MILLYCIFMWLIGIGYYKDSPILNDADKAVVILLSPIFMPILIGQNLK